MARNYSTRDYLRQLPGELLVRYFAGHAVLGEWDAAALAKDKRHALFESWLALPPGKRQAMDAEMQEMSAQSDEKGFRGIVDEAAWHLRNDQPGLEAFTTLLGKLANHHARAMVTFLDHRMYWRGACRFSHADGLPYWRKRLHMGHGAAAVDDASLQQLAKLIRDYFHRTEGRGNNCLVEPLRRGNLDYFFAYPEDFSQQSPEWVDGQFKDQPHTPAFEVVFVYSQADGSLDLNFRGSYKALEPLQAMFAKVILKLPDLPPNPKDARVYDLAPLMQKSFDFVPTVGSGITRVVVRRLRLSSTLHKGERIALEADTLDDPKAVYALKDKLDATGALAHYAVTQVELAATVQGVEGERPKTVVVKITHPNSCSLKHDGRDLVLREMLSASGIEPKEPDDAKRRAG